MSYLRDMDDPPVPKLVSTVPMNQGFLYPGVSSIDEEASTVCIRADLGEIRMSFYIPRPQWDCELERMNAHMHPWTVAQRFLNDAFDKALRR